MKKIVERFPKSMLLIIGEGPLRSKLIVKIREAKLQQNIRIIGKVPNSDMPNYYSSADITFSLSRKALFRRNDAGFEFPS